MGAIREIRGDDRARVMKLRRFARVRRMARHRSASTRGASVSAVSFDTHRRCAVRQGRGVLVLKTVYKYCVLGASASLNMPCKLAV